ncbi:MAG: AraC family transcriptional regulator [Abyssibacter sp.]|uniref:AraC family transcriptional regulator n=1 Tax=Abyssibacter sp. TaxID=2320200 RepID=UPI00321BE38E
MSAEDPAVEPGLPRSPAFHTLADRIAHWTPKASTLDTAIRGLCLHHWTAPTEPTSYHLPASLCLIGQGHKRLFLGDKTFDYDAHRFLITAVDLPVVTQILTASPAAPYLGLTLAIDFADIADLMVQHPSVGAHRTAHRHSVAVTEISRPLLDAVNRLLDLLATPGDIYALAPLIKREIFYRLLQSEHGPRLRQIATTGHHQNRIAKAIDWLGQHYRESVRMEDLAQIAGLSASAFNQHFRAVTSLSPLQYQKKMRLNKARQLMLTERIDASSAAFEVGYESPSQFSREYRRQFGAPPRRDIAALRSQAS